MRLARAVALLALSLTVPRVTSAQARELGRMMRTAEHWTGPRTTPANERAAEQWSSRGRALYDSSRYRESIASYERALQLGAGRPEESAWNIARGYARLRNRKQALRWLGHALDLGFTCRETIRHEPAFEEYRDDERYLELMDVSAFRRDRRPIGDSRVS
jgi:tetratricopeptide (TPR) repeat protein